MVPAARSTQPHTLSDARCDRVMSPDVVAAPRFASMRDVAAAMAAHRVHAVVVDDESAPQPLAVTALDVVAALVPGAEDKDAGALAGSLPMVRPRDSLETAVRRMAEEAAGHVLVRAARADAPAGVISALDVAAVVAGRDPHALRAAAEPPALHRDGGADAGTATVAAIMHRGILSVAPDAPLTAAAGLMAQERIHALVLSGTSGRGGREHEVWTVLSAGDLVAAADAGILSEPAGAVAGTEPVVIGEAERVQAAAARMVEHSVAHLIAVDAAGRPSGVLSALDVVVAVAAAD